MTTLNQARDAVYKRFLAEWKDGAQPLTPFCFDNETLNTELVWARCIVRSLPGGQETLGTTGNRKYKRRAFARVQIYTKPGSGTKQSDTLCQAAMTLFEGRSLLGTTVKFFDASPAEIGLVDDNRWFLSTVTAYFDYEEVK